MSVWIHKNSRVITQGITGKAGMLHTEQCLAYGTQIVGGVTPGKGGQMVGSTPVFDTVFEAKKNTGCDVSMIFVPAPFAKEAILEAEEAGIELIVCITEGIPMQDMLEVSHIMKTSNSRLIGPNCPGIIVPGVCKVGIMPGYIHKPGCIGIVSRSGTLTYEAVWQTTKLGFGQSTCIGIGGDPLHGVGFIDVLKAFEQDESTQAILLIGEIGGREEEEAADWISNYASKPIAAFIAGQSAPKGQRMGHAGALISQGEGGALSKIASLEKAGVTLAYGPEDMGSAVAKALESQCKNPVSYS